MCVFATFVSRHLPLPSSYNITLSLSVSFLTFRCKQGIIGAVAFAVSSSSRIDESDADGSAARIGNDISSANAATSSSPEVQEIVNMLDSVRTSCSSQEHFEYFCSSDTTEGETDSAIAQFFDELCLTVRGGRLAHPIKEWIMGNFSELLEESFLGDIVDDSTQKPSETEDQATGLVIADASDRAIIAGTSANPRAPTGAMRFNIDGEDARA